MHISIVEEHYDICHRSICFWVVIIWNLVGLKIGVSRGREIPRELQ